VLEKTVERCATAGLAVALLDPWRDVDTAADLTALLPDLDLLPGRRTAALLRELAGADGVSADIPSSSSHKRPEPHRRLTAPNPQEVPIR
jgi:hypothetical protein